MPKISIITPFYNSKNTLKQCIQSVLSQSFEDFEFILINDGSIDKSLEIAEKFAIYDDRIKIFSKENEGQGLARNFALKRAKGDIIYYLDSDDWLEEDALLKIYEKFKKDNPDIVIFNVYKYYEKINKKTPYFFAENYYLKFKESVFSPIMAQDILFSRGAWPYRAYNRDFLIKNDIKYSTTRFIEDSEFYIKAFLYADKIACLNEYILNHRIHNNSTTYTKNNNIKIIYNTFFACEEILENSKYKDNKKILSSFLNNRIRQLFYYFALVNKKNKKDYYNMFRKIVIYIKNKYGADYIEKNISATKLNDIIKYNYEIYKLKRKLYIFKSYLKHYF